MKHNKISLLALIICIATTSGCASYRTSSNIKTEPTSVVDTATNVIITEGDFPDKKYEVIGPIKVSIKKLTAFHKDPTKEQANEKLIEKARSIGANAVINVNYKSGIGLTTWGYMDAKGTGVKVVEQELD